nr:MAG TPA: hypothetical protein [Caudoviricetes sp.]
MISSIEELRSWRREQHSTINLGPDLPPAL